MLNYITVQQTVLAATRAAGCATPGCVVLVCHRHRGSAPTRRSGSGRFGGTLRRLGGLEVDDLFQALAVVHKVVSDTDAAALEKFGLKAVEIGQANVTTEPNTARAEI